MNSKAYKEFNEFLLQLSEDNFSRIGFKLGGKAYTELMSNWITFLEERTSMLDSEAQLFLILLILEASK